MHVKGLNSNDRPQQNSSPFLLPFTITSISLSSVIKVKLYHTLVLNSLTFKTKTLLKSIGYVCLRAL